MGFVGGWRREADPSTGNETRDSRDTVVKGVCRQEERCIEARAQQGSNTSYVVHLGIRRYHRRVEALCGPLARTMKEAIQSRGWRQLWRTARKRKKKHTNDARYEGRGVKTREGKKVFQQTFLVCSYIMLIFGAAGGGTDESATFPPCSFSTRSSIAGIFLQEVKTKWAHMTQSRFAKRPELAAKRGSHRHLRDICGRLCATRGAHEQHHVRLYCGHACRCVLRWTDT